MWIHWLIPINYEHSPPFWWLGLAFMLVCGICTLVVVLNGMGLGITYCSFFSPGTTQVSCGSWEYSDCTAPCRLLCCLHSLEITQYFYIVFVMLAGDHITVLSPTLLSYGQKIQFQGSQIVELLVIMLSVFSGTRYQPCINGS